MIIRKWTCCILSETPYSAVRAREIRTETANVDVAELLLGGKVNAGDLLEIYLLLSLLVYVIPIYKFFPLTRVNVIITEILFLLFLIVRFPDHFEPVPFDLAVARPLVIADLLLDVVDDLLDFLLLVGHFLRILNVDGGVPFR